MHNCISLQAVMHTDVRTMAPQNLAMASYKEEALAYLRLVIETTGRTASALARDIGVSTTTFTRPLNDPDHKYAVKFQALQDLSEKTGVALPTSLTSARAAGRSKALGEIRLPIAFEVAASGFVERDDLPQRPFGFAKVPTVAPYADCPQWLERVVNDSMDRLLPPGSIIHVVDTEAIRYRPRHDDIVVVERTRNDGALVERTVKQVALLPGGSAELWPRSHNARWSAPVRLLADVADGEEVTVRIVGLVLRSYMFFAAEPEDAEAAS